MVARTPTIDSVMVCSMAAFLFLPGMLSPFPVRCDGAAMSSGSVRRGGPWFHAPLLSEFLNMKHTSMTLHYDLFPSSTG